MIERSSGIYSGIGGYYVGAGYCGLTEDLDEIVKKEAEILEEVYASDVQIRFNTNQRSGGAWIIDGKDNCSIGLTAALQNSKISEMSEEQFFELSRIEWNELMNNADKIMYSVGVNYDNTINSLNEEDIYYDKMIFKDFSTLDEAVNFLKSNVFGLNMLTVE